MGPQLDDLFQGGFYDNFADKMGVQSFCLPTKYSFMAKKGLVFETVFSPSLLCNYGPAWIEVLHCLPE